MRREKALTIGTKVHAKSSSQLRAGLLGALPLVVDADDGFGNALNVQRTVRTFERAGASAIMLEDQAAPKRCGHLAGKTLISATEMVGKVKAAVDARADAGTLIMARTDAVGVEGFPAAMDRAARYVEAGADMLFVEAPQSIQQLREICDTFGERIPLVANMVEGGATPIKSLTDLEEMGFRVVFFPGAAVRVVAGTLRAFFADLKADGSSRAWTGRMLDLKDLNDLLGTNDILELGRRYDGGIAPATS